MSIKRKSAIEEQFDKDSHQYLSKHLTPIKIRERERILNLIDKRAKLQNILDLGCGPGTISESLFEISENVWGIDISKDMVNIATERFVTAKSKSKIFFETGDAENLKFQDNYFDAVVCLGLLRYLDSWKSGLKEIYRVLKPDGIVIVSFYYRFSPHWFSMFFIYRPLLPIVSIFKRRSFRDLMIKYKAEPLPFSYTKFMKAFRSTGFRHTKTQHSGFDIFPFNRLFPKLSTSLYLKAENKFYDSNKLGWLGSICIVKGFK